MLCKSNVVMFNISCHKLHNKRVLNQYYDYFFPKLCTWGVF